MIIAFFTTLLSPDAESAYTGRPTSSGHGYTRIDRDAKKKRGGSSLPWNGGGGGGGGGGGDGGGGGYGRGGSGGRKVVRSMMDIRAESDAQQPPCCRG